jgi:hypothetical protein
MRASRRSSRMVHIWVLDSSLAFLVGRAADETSRGRRYEAGDVRNVRSATEVPPRPRRLLAGPEGSAGRESVNTPTLSS